MKQVLISILVLGMSVCTMAGNYDNWQDYSGQNEVAKFPARNQCLKAAQTYFFPGKYKNFVYTRGSDSDEIKTKYIWNGNVVLREVRTKPHWYTIRDCKAGIIKGSECLDSTERSVVWKSSEGIVDKENAATLGPATDKLIGYLLSKSVMPVQQIQDRAPANLKKIEQLQSMYENCKGLKGVMVPEGNSKINSDFYIKQNQARIEAAHAASGASVQLKPRKSSSSQ
jgi:hypothetical protein